jgi:hypothetical protein
VAAGRGDRRRLGTAYAQLAAAVGFHVTDVEDAAELVRAFIAGIDRAL